MFCEWPFCGSWLACDAGNSVFQVHRSDAIAGKPAPTGEGGVHLTSGGVVKVWYGAGEGMLHSSPSAPSHGLAGAGLPPRMHLMTMNRKKICVVPKMNAPMEETMLKSANCRL